MGTRLRGRGADILSAALKLLQDGGTEALTTSALARLAGCSKKTIYTLFEDRSAVLAALVARQSESLNSALTEVDLSAEPRAALINAGAKLLELLTSEPSLVINRAALADASGALSRILVETGKGRSAPLLTGLMERMRARGEISFDDTAEAYRMFFGLLVGDRQILALHRVEQPVLDETARLEIAGRAVRNLTAALPGGNV